MGYYLIHDPFGIYKDHMVSLLTLIIYHLKSENLRMQTEILPWTGD